VAHLDCLVVVTPGVEEVAAQEVRSLGVKVPEVLPGGLPVRVPWARLADLLVRLRTASRILVRTGPPTTVESFAELARAGRLVPWERWLPPGSAVVWQVSSSGSRLYHTDAVAERLADAASARVPGLTRVDPGLLAEAGAQRVVARLVHDRLTLSVDAAGEHLHRRGWRLATAKAPLREHLAAAVLLASGWDPATAFVDPCCGSGTLAIEAALLARDVAPGLARAFAAERWPVLPLGTFDAARARAAALVRPAAAPIVAADHLDGAVRATAANAARAGVGDLVEVRRADVADLVPPPGRGALVTNPPYGIRVERGAPLPRLYATIGRVCRERLPGWRVAVLTVPGPLGPALHLPLAPALTTSTGGTRVVLLAGAVPGGSEE